jgi:hypothetical protein
LLSVRLSELVLCFLPYYWNGFWLSSGDSAGCRFNSWNLKRVERTTKKFGLKYHLEFKYYLITHVKK